MCVPVTEIVVVWYIIPSRFKAKYVQYLFEIIKYHVTSIHCITIDLHWNKRSTQKNGGSHDTPNFSRVP